MIRNRLLWSSSTLFLPNWFSSLCRKDNLMGARVKYLLLPVRERLCFFHLCDISTGNDYLKTIDIQTELLYIFPARKQCLIKHGKIISILTL
jgi:hypothetical protein